ncbi:MAG: efflux RND transporter periplasmic adaptor subunit [Spirochaetaceae bacterium]|nr:MAG: efflux RND transporter periplasmic adaptor subunit [Spirochaetaceae bacterium]
MPKLTRKRIVILVIGLLLLLMILGGLARGGRKGKNEKPDKGELPVSVQTMILEPGPITDYILLNGEIQPKSSVDVYADTAGELISLSRSNGDRISRGDTIGQIDPSRPGQRFAPSAITAPISGTIVMVNPRIGSQISPQMPVARIATTNELEITTNVPERYINNLAIGQPALIQLDAFPDLEFDATVSELDPLVNPQNRTLQTTMVLKQHDERIRPGMFARVKIITAQIDDALVIPQTAVIRQADKAYVYVLDADQLAAQRQVITGIQIDGKVQLIDGVQAGETVITRGQNMLEDGRSVRILNEE